MFRYREGKKTGKGFMTLLVMLLSLSMAAPAMAQDRAFDRYKHSDASINYGRGAMDSDDAAYLSWGEAYYLDSYIDIYNHYKDTYWLDKFVEHFDAVKANAIDPEEDGSLGWYSPRYSRPMLVNEDFEDDAQDINADEVILNGGFESAGADLVPANWTRAAGTNTTVYRTTAAGEYYSGSAGLAVKYNNGNAATLKQTISYDPGRTYNLSFAAKTDSRATVAQIEIYNESAATVVAATSSFWYDMIYVDEWLEKNFVFTAPAVAGQTVSVRIKLIKLDQSGWAAYFDDISLKPVETIVNEVKNSDFETADAGDATLPDQWSRLGSSTYTYLSGSSGEYYSGDKGVVVKSNGVGWQEIYQRLPYTPGETYSLTAMGKTNSASAYGRILVYNLTDQTYILDQTFNNTSWEKQSHIFTAPSVPGKTLNIYLRHYEYTHPSWIVYFDDLKIEPYTKNVNGNPSFYEVDGGDATLPAGWSRFQSTSDNAYVATGLNEYFTFGKGAAIESDNEQVPMLQKPLYLIPGMKYQVAFRGRNNLPAAQGQVEVYNSGGSASLGSKTFNDTSWTFHSFDVTAPASLTDTVYLRLRQATTAADNTLISYMDDVQVVPVVERGFAAWERVNKTKETAYATNATGNSFGGSYGLVIGNDGSTDGYVKQRLTAYQASKPYSVYFYGKTGTAANDGKVVVYDVTANSQLASMTFEDLDWTDYRLDFTTPGDANHVIEIRLTQQFYNNSSQYAYFDRVSVGERVGNLVNDTMVIKPALKFIKAVYEDSSLDEDYGETAAEYLDFIVEDEVLPKWSDYFVDLGDDRGTYVFPEGDRGGLFPGRTMPHNQYLVAAECYLLLWDITEISSYKDRAEQLLNFFKDNLRAHSVVGNSAYEWNYWNPSGSWDDGITYVSAEEDTSHANMDISAAITAYHLGVVFTHEDMEKFASTFVDGMWNGSTSNPVIGSNLVFNNNITEFLYGWTPYVWEFVELAEFDPQIWDIIQATVNNRGGSGMLPLLAGLAVFNPETVVNGTFEMVDGDDATLPTRWNRWSGWTTAYRDTSNAYLGNAGVALITNGTEWNILQQPLTGYLPNSPYELKFYGKATTGVHARADVYNYTASSLLGTTAVSATYWDSKSFSFTSPANPNDAIYVDLYHNLYATPDLYAYIDNVRVYPSLWNSFAPNGGFEEADMFDGTLPRYWKRSDTTVSGKVVLDASEKYKGANSIKLTTETGGGNPAQQLVYTLKGLKPSASYTLTFYSKTNGSSAKARARVRNETASTNLATSGLVDTTSWTNFTVNFTAPSTYTDEVKVYLEHNDPSVAGGIAYFDEVGVLLN